MKVGWKFIKDIRSKLCLLREKVEYLVLAVLGRWSAKRFVHRYVKFRKLCQTNLSCEIKQWIIIGMSRLRTSSQSQENWPWDLFEQNCELFYQISFWVTFSCNLFEIQYFYIGICKVKILSHQLYTFFCKASHLI